MPAQYPFIDVAVHDLIRPRLARGEALVLFAPALERVLWCNGAGARFFGVASIYDFIEEGPNRGDVTFRQVESAARQLVQTGDSRSLMLRVTSGFQKVPITAVAERIEVRRGEPVVLLAIPALSPRAAEPAQLAVDLMAGFDDPDTHMAVLDGDGMVIAGSPDFASLKMTPQTARMLINLVEADGHRLIKRPVPTGRGYLPAAIGKISDAPSLHLLFAVETILGQMDPSDDFAMDEAEAEVAAEAKIEMEPVVLPVASAEPVSADDGAQMVDEATAASVEPSAGPIGLQPAFDSVMAALSYIEEIEAETDEVQSLTAEEAEAFVEPEVELVPEGVADTLVEMDETIEDDTFDAALPIPADGSIGDVEIADLPLASHEIPVPADVPEADPAPVIDEILVDAFEAESPLADKPVDLSTSERMFVDNPVRDAEHFVFDAGRRATRFVWKIDAEGRFSDVSAEFAQAVGPRAADINGVAFSDLAALFNLDPEGKIGELLKKRDTWSGKTIYWPVEGTSLTVPVDLAALPTYTRNRDFDGFRGFGIVRVSDAVEDPNATGLTFVPQPPEAPVETGEPLVFDTSSDEDLEEFLSELREGEIHPPELFDEVEDFSDEDEADDLTVLDDDASDLRDEIEEEADAGPESTETEPQTLASTLETEGPTGERGREPPVLRIMELRKPSLPDTVVQLEDHRTRQRDSLTPGEQAAFREIARKLDPLGLRARVEQSLNATDRTSDKATEAGADKEPPVLRMSESAAPRSASLDEPQMPASVEPETAIESVDTPVVDMPVVNMPPVPVIEGLPPKRERSLTAEIVDLMPVALLVHVGDRLIHANPEFMALTGYPSLADLDAAGGLDALIQRQDLDRPGDQAGRVVAVCADDRLVPVTARLQSIRFEDASALMLALIAQPDQAEKAAPPSEATLQLQAQPPAPAGEIARLKVEVDELRSILETATDGVVILDADGDIRSMNRAASALFNFDDMETRGKPFVMLFAHESQKSILDYLSGLAGHGVASVLNDGREVIGREASGGFLPLFMTIGQLNSSNGYCAVIRDITQWKRTEEELRNAKRAAETANAHKTDFLARVSHEIRTPLNAIIGFADMMANEHFGPVGHPRYGEYAHDIVRSGRHVLDIVNDLLDISKIEAGEMELDFASVGLNDMVQAAVSIVQPQANSQRVIIRTALSQAVPNVVADGRSIKQIVLNILANAIRFTPSGGQIIVSTAYEANGSVALRIRDTGIGMSRGELEQAMKPFRQVSTGTPRNRGDGTGLGLPLTKAMVDANRAAFAISSTPNEGTLVEVTFPSPRVLAD